MVERFQLLRNVGQFDSVNAGAQIPLTKLTLVYAENGRGKTTLASILRSLGAGSHSLITERHRLGASHPPHVVVSARGQSFIFQNGAWTGQLPEIAVFDDNFVAQNVCSGIEIENEHRQNLHELILGAQGVALNATLQACITRIEEHNKSLKIKGDAIPASARGTLTPDAFCALQTNDKIDAEIQDAERALAAAQAADAVRQQAEFLPIELPSFDVEAVNQLLQQGLPELQAEAVANVQSHLSKLGKDAESWVGDGMQKIPGASAGSDREICPFCSQGLSGSPIIEHYQAYFSDAYKVLKQTIIDTGKAVASTHGNDIPAAFERAVRVAAQNAEFWGKFIEVPELKIDTAEIARDWKVAREAVLAALRAKLAAPLELSSLQAETISAITTYHYHRAKMAALSEGLRKTNEQIALVKEKAASSNVPALNNDLMRLKSVKARFSANMIPICLAYLDEKEAKKATETARDQARAALDLYRETVFSSYETAINSYLGRFNAGFRLGSVTSVNNRGGSSCTYNVLINNISVSITASTGPSFKNTLSAGDRNTLALAFFFASLDQDQSIAQKIVVIDDPMTSLDEHRSLTTVQEIRQLLNRVSQAIVLSHSKPFLCQIWEGADTNIRSAMRIAREGTGSTLAVWDVNQDCITEHDRRHAMVLEHIESSNPSNERAVATALRPILEVYTRVAYSNIFRPGDLLGMFRNQCQQRIGTSDEILNQADTDELRHLLDYANKFHHDTNPAWATELINDQELVGFCRRTLKFIQRS